MKVGLAPLPWHFGKPSPSGLISQLLLGKYSLTGANFLVALVELALIRQSHSGPKLSLGLLVVLIVVNLHTYRPIGVHLSKCMSMIEQMSVADYL